MISQRDREVDQIAKSIGELAELFQDLSALVIDQGTMLDRIDFNIEHMGQDMQAAVRELNDATRWVATCEKSSHSSPFLGNAKTKAACCPFLPTDTRSGPHEDNASFSLSCSFFSASPSSLSSRFGASSFPAVHRRRPLSLAFDKCTSIPDVCKGDRGSIYVVRQSSIFLSGAFFV